MSTDPVAVLLNAADAPIMVTGDAADTSNMTPSLPLLGSLLVATVNNDKVGATEGAIDIEGIMVGETDVEGILDGEAVGEKEVVGEDDGKLDDVGRVDEEGTDEGKDEIEGAVDGAHPS